MKRIDLATSDIQHHAGAILKDSAPERYPGLL